MEADDDDAADLALADDFATVLISSLLAPLPENCE